jgi:outer membrane protein assembly factor BamB
MNTQNPMARVSERTPFFAIYSFLFILCILSNDLQAQIQQAWVAHYNNGISNSTNQAVKMALDSSGNIYVTGFSQNTNTNLGYITIKYAPNGNQLWASRYDSTNYPSATPSGLVLDNSNDVIITGNALTVKYGPNGNQMWTAPYVGTALAVDSNANVYVTGFGTQFNTVKLSPSGSNLWQTTYVDDVGPTLSQAILVDSNSNVYITGSDNYYHDRYSSYVQLATIKYNTDGGQMWMATDNQPVVAVINVKGLALDGNGNLYIEAAFNVLYGGYYTYKYASNGNLTWSEYAPTEDDLSVPQGLALDAFGNAFVTGVDGYYYPNMDYDTYKIAEDGTFLWTNSYPQPPVGISGANAITVDSGNNVYVTGYSPGTNSANDIVTIKYDNNGAQSWLQRYNGPGNGNDAGNAIAVDNNGNVYVTGYDTTTAGGTEIVTIKYSPLVLQRQSNGTVLLQAQGSPGESFTIQASADLQSWLDLGSAMADTNGLMQFDDTNASNYSARFYSTSPQ